MKVEELINGLNAATKEERLANLRELAKLHKSGELPMPKDGGYVNSHIHTTYSFSPYSPTKAVYMAWINGLTTAGIVDHDSVSGCREFVEAGEIVGMITTIGMECRVSFKNTPFKDRRLNNPDQIACGYVLAHGIPHQSIDKLVEFMKPYRLARNERNKKMVDNINNFIKDSGIVLDFEKDIIPLSNWDEGGSVTERHLLYGLATKIVELCGKGQKVIDFLIDKFGLSLSDKQIKQMLDLEYSHYEYDLLGILKGSLVEKIYVDATDECPDVKDFLAAVKEIGAVSAYAYLGDVGDSVTGDKKAQKFEDDYLDELIPYVKELGFNALAYMPSRNTLAQLERLMKLCKENDLFQISGEDINSPRQAFVNDKIKEEPFRHLITATWTLIGHEKQATENIDNGMFTETTIKKYPTIEERISYFSECGKNKERENMKTKAVRLYGKNDLRFEEMILPEIDDDGVQMEVVSDSLCMSTYKATIEGPAHKRVPDDVAENPIIVGHEFCGKITKVGKNWEDKFKVGEGVVIQPAHYYKGSLLAPGYSYANCGGNSQYVNIPIESLLMDCLIPYNSDEYFKGSLVEPMSCVIGTFHAMYHTRGGQYVHDMGIVEGGTMALLAGIGPMGLGAIDYALHCDRRPSVLVVTSTNDEKLARAASIFTVEHAREMGVELHYVNTKKSADPVKELRDITGGKGYNDVICFAPASNIIEIGDQILGFDGCLNIFAGPADSQLKAEINMFNVHYSATHLVATSSGNSQDMREAIELMEKGIINPAAMVTHIGGLDCVAETTKNLPNIWGSKKLIYNHISLPLTAIIDFEELGKTDPMFAELDKLCKKHNGLWNGEAEKYLLANAKAI